MKASKMTNEQTADAIEAAYKREVAAKDRKIELLEMALKISNGMNDAAAKMAVAKDAEIEKLRFEIMKLKSEQRTAGEVIIEQTNKVEAKDAEIAELRELLIELANAAETAFDEIAKCGSIIADGDVRDAAYRIHLMERIAKYRKALEGVNDEQH